MFRERPAEGPKVGFCVFCVCFGCFLGVLGRCFGGGVLGGVLGVSWVCVLVCLGVFGVFWGCSGVFRVEDFSVGVFGVGCRV